MIFNPSTQVRLLSNVPMDSTYSHTILFPSVTDQTSYFFSKTKFYYDNFSYQRYNPQRGRLAAIRVPEVADNLYAVNYLMFVNSNFGSKWFYGFVKEINYINDGMSEIVYELDILQTWMFDFTIHPSFIAREHVEDDSLYKHLVEENLETGQLIIASVEDVTNMKPENCWVVAACSFSQYDEQMKDFTNYTAVSGGTIGYQYNGLTYWAFDSTLKMNQFLQYVTDAALSSGIVNIFMFPKPFWPINDPNTGVEAQPTIQTIYNKCNQKETFGSYTPKNNKLYTFPYNFIHINNGNGGSADFRYEYFTDTPGQPVFAVSGALSCSPDFAFCPMNYKVPAGTGFNWNEVIGLGSYPICSWTTDTYRAYLAQNASRLVNEQATIALGAGVKAASGIARLFTGDIGGGVAELIGGAIDTGKEVASVMARESDLALQPPQASTTCGNETAFALNLRNFQIYNYQITEQFARKIDAYFSMFGYQVNEVKVPNLTSRQSWNYIKTIDIQITGNMPVDDMNLLCAIFNKGITFWHSYDVGNYDLPNGVV